MPWWDPYGVFFQLGWFIILIPTLGLVAFVYILDWLTPKCRWGSRFLTWIGA